MMMPHDKRKGFALTFVLGAPSTPPDLDDPDVDEEDDEESDEEDPEDMTPEEADNCRIVQEAALALTGRSKHADEAINEFLEVFGKKELAHLKAMVEPEEGAVVVTKKKPIRAAEGRLVEGPGRGMEDRIPAMAGDQPYLLSDGEFVIPADVVSFLGDGSTQAGTRVLEAMIERVRTAKTGESDQAGELDLEEMLPA